MEWQTAASLSGENAQVLTDLGIIHSHLGESELAMKAFERVCASMKRQFSENYAAPS
jgi:Flp pilus assembly protein TadD